MTELTVSVRELALFCFRRGDIDHRFRPSATALEGIEGHQRTYRRRPDSYRPEYPVSYSHQSDHVSLLLRGRADGYDASRGIVEEIKTCRVAPASIPEALTRLHLAQGQLYAAMIAAAEGCTELEVQLTWLHLDEDREYSLSQRYSRDELDAFLQQALQQFSGWIEQVAGQLHARDASLENLAFPHPEFRQGQRDIAERVYKCIDQGGQLLLEAPTGIGKTAAVLFPALKALGTGKHDRLVFCTAKTSGRRAAESAMLQLVDAGYRGRALSLSAKERVCLSPGKACHGDDCSFARGYYDRLPAAMTAAMEQPALRREDLQALAEQFSVCPYELAWDLLPWMDTVIADVHFVYSLSSTLAERQRESGQRLTVVLDEAHNLPGRARDMYSATLSKALVMGARTAVGKDKGPLRKALDRINRVLLTLQKQAWQQPDWHSLEQVPEELLQALQLFATETGQQMAERPLAMVRMSAVLELYFDVLQLMRCAGHWGPEYRCEFVRSATPQSLQVRFNCLDAARLLQLRQSSLHSSVAFSATLSPPHWVRESLGLSDSAVCFQARSPFLARQLRVSVATHIDTRYQQRQGSLPALAKLLQEWLRDVPGNCLLYFPSYRYMQDCMASMGALPQRSVQVQAAGAPDMQRDELLSLLSQRRDVAAFCILGGVFGEGIDLPGDELSSVVVVGVGLPQVNRDTTTQQAFYQNKYGEGFACAYQYPGMQKVSQALGRVIRGTQDQGQALLVDSRYRQASYRRLLPPWWDYRDYR